MYTSHFYIVLCQLWTLCDVSLRVIVFVYQIELVHFRALWSAVETCNWLSCLLIAIEHIMQISSVIFVTCHRPSVCSHVCLPVWNIAAHNGRNFVSFIWDKFTKVFFKIPHFGKSNEYARRYVVRPEHIWHVGDVSTNISPIECGDRLLIRR